MSQQASVTVRRATPDDDAAIGRLGALLMSQHHGYDPRRFIAAGPGAARGYGDFLASEIGRQGVIVLVAEQGGEVLGYVYGEMEGHDWMALRGPAGVLHDLVVDPTRRGEGIGQILLKTALEALATLGAPRVVLSTASQNTAAQRMFEAAGFRPTMIEMTRERSD